MVIDRDTRIDLRGGDMVHDDGSGGEERAHLKLERGDYIKGLGVIFGAISAALAIVVPLAMYVFQTRADATVAHNEMNARRAAIGQKLAIDAAVKVVESKHQKQSDDDVTAKLNALVEGAEVQHTNTQRIMWELELKPKPLPAGLKTGGTP